MKKLGVLFLVVLVALTLTACKKDKTVDKEDNFTEIIDISKDETDDKSKDVDKTEEVEQPDNANKVGETGKP